MKSGGEVIKGEMEGKWKIGAIAIVAMIAISVFAGIMLVMAQTATTATPQDSPETSVSPGMSYIAYNITYTNSSGPANLTWFNVTGMNASILNIGDIDDIVNVSVWNATNMILLGYNNTRRATPPYFTVNLTPAGVNSSNYKLTIKLTINTTGLTDGTNISINATLRSHNFSNNYAEDLDANDPAPETIEVLNATMGTNDVIAAQGQKFVMVANVTIDPGNGTIDTNLTAIRFNITPATNMSADSIESFALFYDNDTSGTFDPAIDKKIATISPVTDLNASFSGLTSLIPAGANATYFLTMNISDDANITANNTYQVYIPKQGITITEGTGDSTNTSNSSLLRIVAEKYADNDPSLLDADNSTLMLIKPSAVANNTDKLTYMLIAKDSNNRLITGVTFYVSSNRTEKDTITPSTITTNETGVALFNVTSTLAGPVNITVSDSRNANKTISNTTGVFTAGPPYKLAWFGPDNSLTGVNTISQSVAIQDEYGNNVTWDTLSNIDPFRLVASIVDGNATVISANPIIVDENNISASFTASGVNYSAAFDLANFTFQGSGTVTIKVAANRTLQPATKDITFQAPIDHLEVTTNKTSMFANGGNDSILVTVQLKDADNNDIQSTGVTIELSASTYPDLFNITNPSNTTDATGKATFVVRSTTKDGEDSLDAVVTYNPAGGTGQTGTSDIIKLVPCFAPSTSSVVNSTATILAGETSTITAMIKAYDGEAFTDKEVTFNLTSGDGHFTDGTTLTTVMTDSNGNASVEVTSTNATNNVLVINVTTLDEFGVERQVGALQYITVQPNVPTKLDISPARKIGLKNVPGTSQNFTLQLQDEYGNDNTTAETPVLITTDNPELGNMTCAGTTTAVNNNLWCNISTGGNVTFTYTVNSTKEGTANLTIKVMNFTITDNITITTSGPKGIRLTFNKTLPLVGETVQSIAQLTDAEDNPLRIEGIVVTFTLRDPDNRLLDVNTSTTNDSGIALYNFTGNVYGSHTVTATNDTYALSNTNTTTFVGNATELEISVNKTTPAPNETILINATFKDAQGYVTSSEDGGTVRFLKDGFQFATATISNGVATTTYTQAEPGTVNITAFYNATLQDMITVTFTLVAKNFSVNITPSEVTVNESTLVTVNVTDADTGAPVEGATVNLSGCGVELSNTTNASGIATFEVNANSTGIINVTVSMSGYNDWEGTITVKSPPSVCPWDLSGPAGEPDGEVNIFDIVAVADHWGETGAPGWIPEDLSGPANEPDGLINIFDIVAVADHWGPCP